MNYTNDQLLALRPHGGNAICLAMRPRGGKHPKQMVRLEKNFDVRPVGRVLIHGLYR